MNLEEIDEIFGYHPIYCHPTMMSHIFPAPRLLEYRETLKRRVQQLEAHMPLNDEQDINNWCLLIEDAAYLQDAISNQLAIYLS